MKVVHINQSDSEGGAAVACRRLHRGLLSEGIDSKLLVGTKTDGDNSVCLIDPDESEDSDRVRIYYGEKNRTALSNTHFSFPGAPVSVCDHPEVRGADVIHLHWVSEMLSVAEIGKLFQLGKPVFWTLHDLNPLTGGCHFPAGCRKFENNCEPCHQLKVDPFGLPAAVLRDKIALWNPDNVTLICPSEWIATEAQKSRLFYQHPRIQQLPNGLDINLFSRKPATDLRKKLGIEESTCIVLLGSADGREIRKGFDQAAVALKTCLEDDRFDPEKTVFLRFGLVPEPLPGIPVIDLGWIESESDLAAIYSASDVMIFPSLEDNLPNMAVEAACCGVPICGFKVGGVSDIVLDGETGYLVNENDSLAVAERVLQLVADKNLRNQFSKAAGKFARATFDNSKSCSRIIECYQTELERVLSDRASTCTENERSRSNILGPAVDEILPDLADYCRERELAHLKAEIHQLQAICDERQKVIDGLVSETNLLRRACEERLHIIRNNETFTGNIHRTLRRWLKK